MNSLSGDFDQELTDTELDAMLVRARHNVASHVRATANPTAALVAIMAACDQRDHAYQERPDSRYCPSRRLAPQRLVAVVEIRRRAAEMERRLQAVAGLAADLAADLDMQLSQHGDLPIATRCTRAFAQHCDRRLVQLLSRAHDLVAQIAQDMRRVQQLDRDLAVDRDVEVIRELSSDVSSDWMFDRIRELDHAYAQARQADIGEQIGEARDLGSSLDKARRLIALRQRWQGLDRANAQDLATAVSVVLQRVGALAAGLMYRIDALEVDVKHADLSDVRIPGLDLLRGVFWNQDTVWPPGIADQVERISRPVTDGVRQVRPDGQRPAVSLSRHAAERLPQPSRFLLP